MVCGGILDQLVKDWFKVVEDTSDLLTWDTIFELLVIF